MNRTILTDSQWLFLAHFLPGKTSDCGVTAKDNRTFLYAVLWITRTDSPMRDLPEAFGHCHNVYVRYARWTKKGTWENSLFCFPTTRIYGIIVRVHQNGTTKKLRQNKRREFLGGLTTKIHASVGTTGRPAHV